MGCPAKKNVAILPQTGEKMNEITRDSPAYSN
jgi:hypothetical protein